MNTKSNSRSPKARISNRRILFVAFAAFALLALFSTPRWKPDLVARAAMATAPLSGAIYTSVGDGTAVNHNIYDAKDSVYLNGGPQNQNGPGLPDGTYYFQVTNPSGSVLLSTDLAVCRQLKVSGGRVDGAAGPCPHADGDFNPANGATPVQLVPFDDTPNSGGEYKVSLIRQDTGAAIDPDGIHITFNSNDDKTDNFKVEESVIPGGCLLTAPQDANLGCNPQSIPVCDTSTVEVIEGGDIAVQCVQADPEPVGCVHTRTLTYSATAPDTTTCEVTQTITWTKDTTDPTFSNLPAGGDLGCNPEVVPGDSSFPDVTSNDGCSGAAAVGVTHSDNTVGCVTTRTFTFSATDACLNNATAQVAYSWTVDTKAPTINGVGGPATIECPATPAFSEPTASDGCGVPSLTHEDVTTPGSCAGTYSVTRTWTATDGCGKSSTASQTITVVDTTPPTIGAAGANATIYCPALPVFTAPTTANDSCSTATIVEVSDVTTAGSCGTYRRTKTWQAKDSCGNLSPTRSQTIVVECTNCGEGTIGFWQNKNGQALIKGANQANLAAFLNTYNPFKDLGVQLISTYATNVVKAASSSGAAMNAMLKAQMLSTALDVYFSKVNGNAPIDLTYAKNASSSFGGASCMSVLNMLGYAANRSNAGGSIWYNQVKNGPNSQELAKDAFDAINNEKAFAVFSCP
jgi:hypothetical protein